MDTKITVSKSRIKKDRGVVILPVEECERLLAHRILDVYLTGKEAEDLDKLVEEGLREYREGTTIKANALSEALQKYRTHLYC
jgi:hypothetical protein